MRATFLCLFALQLAFAVMAMPRARAQDAEGTESAGGDVEITTTPAGGDEEAKPEGDGDATDPPAEAVREAQATSGDAEITTTPAGGDEEAKPEGDGDATDPPAEAVREAQATSGDAEIT